MTQTFSYIRYQVEGAVARLTLNLPEKLNGLSGPMQAEVLSVLQQLESQPEVRALIITGQGRAFSAGADLAAMLAMGDGQAQAETTYRIMLENSNPMIMAMRASRLPIVAAVNGIAAGAGVSLALAADIVVAAESAGFLMPFIPRLGIVPDLGMTWALPRLIGDARTRGMLLLGDLVSAQQACDWGLIWQCVKDAELLSVAQGLALRLAAAPRTAAGELKQALVHAEQASLAEQLRYEAERQRELIAAADFQEGVSAFLDKRAPVFL